MQEHFYALDFLGVGMILAAVMLISWKIYLFKEKEFYKDIKKTRLFASVL